MTKRSEKNSENTTKKFPCYKSATAHHENCRTLVYVCGESQSYVLLGCLVTRQLLGFLWFACVRGCWSARHALWSTKAGWQRQQRKWINFHTAQGMSCHTSEHSEVLRAWPEAVVVCSMLNNKQYFVSLSQASRTLVCDDNGSIINSGHRHWIIINLYDKAARTTATLCCWYD